MQAPLCLFIREMSLIMCPSFLAVYAMLRIAHCGMVSSWIVRKSARHRLESTLLSGGKDQQRIDGLPGR